ncbi:MAG: hypothetical protein NVS1B9_01940 [Solirubrobacteraceae bacterium]
MASPLHAKSHAALAGSPRSCDVCQGRIRAAEPTIQTRGIISHVDCATYTRRRRECVTPIGVTDDGRSAG